jgi:hypothetical protein
LINAAASGEWMKELLRTPGTPQVNASGGEVRRSVPAPRIATAKGGKRVASLNVDATWATSPVVPAPGAVAFWLDETGWHLTWSEDSAPRGTIRSPGGKIWPGAGKTAVDTLRFEEANSPLEFRTAKYLLEVDCSVKESVQRWSVGGLGDVIEAGILRIR